MIMSVAQIVCCGSTEGDVIRRAAAIGRATGELRQNGAAGSPAEVLDKLATFAEAGVSRVYLQLMDLDDLDHLHVIAEEVAKLLP
jgi:alkanesulfonate monooxygenase